MDKKLKISLVSPQQFLDKACGIVTATNVGRGKPTERKKTSQTDQSLDWSMCTRPLIAIHNRCCNNAEVCKNRVGG